MKSAVRTASILVGLAGLASFAPPGTAGEYDQKRSNQSVAFGLGVNIPPSNPQNQVVLPSEIRLKVGGVVDFGLGGFHEIVIFKPGFTLEDLRDAGGGDFPSSPPVFVLPGDPAAPLPPELAFLNDQIYYRGINPAGGPPATPATANPSNASNRSEPVVFLEPGTYLVICNVRPHLLNGMFAHVTVDE
jgi:plastocyanin